MSRFIRENSHLSFKQIQDEIDECKKTIAMHEDNIRSNLNSIIHNQKRIESIIDTPISYGIIFHQAVIASNQRWIAQTKEEIKRLRGYLSKYRYLSKHFLRQVDRLDYIKADEIFRKWMLIVTKYSLGSEDPVHHTKHLTPGTLFLDGGDIDNCIAKLSRASHIKLEIGQGQFLISKQNLSHTKEMKIVPRGIVLRAMHKLGINYNLSHVMIDV